MSGAFVLRAATLASAAMLFATRARAQDGWSTPDEERAAPSQAQAGNEPDGTPVIVAFEAGYARRSLYGTPIDAFDASLSIGADLGPLSAGAILEVTPGVTRDGLHTVGASLGGFVEGRAGRLRFGGGLRLGALGVTRVTDGGDLTGATAGVFLCASVDLVSLGERSAVYLVAKGAVDDVGTTLTTGSIGFGVRF